MSRPLLLRDEAANDLIQARDELNARAAGLGARFLLRVRQTLALIEAMPEAFGTVHGEVRAVRVKKFRHVVYYLVFPDRVEVFAVLHGGREPSAWQDRV